MHFRDHLPANINLIIRSTSATNFLGLAKSAMAVSTWMHIFSVAWHGKRWVAFRANIMNIGRSVRLRRAL